MKTLVTLLVVALSASGCIATATPAPVRAAVASYDGNVQNSGVVDFAPNDAGYIVTAHWTVRYQLMAKRYGDSIPTFPAAPKKWPACYIATYEQQIRFGQMNESQKETK